MISIKFPDMFSISSTNLVTEGKDKDGNIIPGHEATSQNLQLLLTSEQGSLFGDPFFGLDLRHNMYEQNFKEIWDDLLRDKIYTAITSFMPQIIVKRRDIVIDRDKYKGTLSVKIKCQDQNTFETNLYNIVLFQSGE